MTIILPIVLQLYLGRDSTASLCSDNQRKLTQVREFSQYLI